MLDLGCGRGRNARYLAEQGFQVDAIDWVDQVEHAPPNLTVQCGDLREPFPYADGTFDAVLDIFCFKHITAVADQRHYLSEVKRVLKSGGHYLLALASVEDGFYGQLPRDERGVVCDPVAGVSSILFTPETLSATLEPYVALCALKRVESTSLMHGQSYPRVALWSVWSTH